MNDVPCVYYSVVEGVERCSIKNYCDYSRCTIAQGIDETPHKPSEDELIAFWCEGNRRREVIE